MLTPPPEVTKDPAETVRPPRPVPCTVTHTGRDCSVGLHPGLFSSQKRYHEAHISHGFLASLRTEPQGAFPLVPRSASFSLTFRVRAPFETGSEAQAACSSALSARGPFVSCDKALWGTTA